MFKVKTSTRLVTAEFSAELNILTLAAYEQVRVGTPTPIKKSSQPQGRLLFFWSNVAGNVAHALLMRKEMQGISFGLSSAMPSSPAVANQNKKGYTARAYPFLFWSKWRDSNSRPPVPEATFIRFFNTIVYIYSVYSTKTHRFARCFRYFRLEQFLLWSVMWSNLEEQLKAECGAFQKAFSSH